MYDKLSYVKIESEVKEKKFMISRIDEVERKQIKMNPNQVYGRKRKSTRKRSKERVASR